MVVQDRETADRRSERLGSRRAPHLAATSVEGACNERQRQTQPNEPGHRLLLAGEDLLRNGGKRGRSKVLKTQSVLNSPRGPKAHEMVCHSAGGSVSSIKQARRAALENWHT
ncbi:hypothetical protein AKJ08_2630 [Vulgatibacter incomptus]|uniref:Uncharacterized protein n=1 Tax=Vulgatibacter incomptus TaxID=1391653 RepID=A0A0K1PFE1_9BACT|nr:hypothetical protein AKJ08_2630 [Vulgatibacter incomptus]